jgi:hypothetical protein
VEIEFLKIKIRKQPPAVAHPDYKSSGYRRIVQAKIPLIWPVFFAKKKNRRIFVSFCLIKGGF